MINIAQLLPLNSEEFPEDVGNSRNMSSLDFSMPKLNDLKLSKFTGSFILSSNPVTQPPTHPNTRDRNKRDVSPAVSVIQTELSGVGKLTPEHLEKASSFDQSHIKNSITYQEGLVESPTKDGELIMLVDDKDSSEQVFMRTED